MGMPLMVIGGLVSTAASVIGQQQQARAVARQADYQAQVAEQNRAIAQAQSQEALAAGAREERRFRQRAEQFAATQRAMFAASGVQMSGSPLNVIGETAFGIGEDVTQLRYNALKSMWGHEVQATSFLNEANQARATAASARHAGRSAWIGGVGSLLSTGAQIWGTQHSSYRRGAIHVGSKAPVRVPGGISSKAGLWGAGSKMWKGS